MNNKTKHKRGFTRTHTYTYTFTHIKQKKNVNEELWFLLQEKLYFDIDF